MNFGEIIHDRLDQVPGLIVTYAPGILLALVIYFFGRILVRKLSATTVSASQKLPNIDLTLAKFFGSVVLFTGMLAIVIFALAAMKINLAFIATIVAALVIAIGFALQESLGDFASGVMLAFFRPFTIGQDVEIGGEKGVVQETGLFATTLLTRDNIEVSVGNGTVFSNTIKNYYAFGERRLDMNFGVSYDADLDKAIAAITGAAKSDDRVKSKPEAPWAKVTELGDSAVNIQLRVWCSADDHRKIKMDMSKRIKMALDKAGIDIPYETCMIIEG